jgi:hypothetical protein
MTIGGRRSALKRAFNAVRLSNCRLLSRTATFCPARSLIVWIVRRAGSRHQHLVHGRAPGRREVDQGATLRRDRALAAMMSP